MAIEVSNLNDTGAGSLRAALEQANANPGLDVITFASGLSGTISLASALPEITGAVTIQGLPAGQSTPVIQIDFAGHAGLVLGSGSNGSSLIGLSLVGASGDALTLVSSSNTIQNNYIGVDLDGLTALANQGNGITITATSRGNLIGSTTPGNSTSFTDLSQEDGYAIASIQGIRYGSTADVPYILCGSATQEGSEQGIGVVSLGAADGSDAWYTVNAATAFAGGSDALTSCYGPEQLGPNTIRVVGSYNSSGAIPPTDTSAFIYTGAIDQANGTTSGFVEYQYPGSTWTFFHSTQAGLVVGNWDDTVTIPDTSKPIIGPGRAFIYDVASGVSIADVAYPGAKSTTAYGIAKVNDDLFAITGSYSLDGEPDGVAHGYLVYYHRGSNSFSDWTSWDVNDTGLGNIASHADGISYNSSDNTFTLATVALDASSGDPLTGQLMTVDRTADGGFGAMRWTEINYPDSSGGSTTPTSVAGDVMTGVFVGSDGSALTWSSETSLFVDPSNLISGNAGHGIAIIGSSTDTGTNNTIAQNRIGTTDDGSTGLANGGNGILIDGASRNLIGGTITGGNDPTKGITTPPPLGNLISGNTLNGVMIIDGASHNTLSGNFIGTSVSGNQKLANGADGVAIIDADDNALLGCQPESSPFVYYNVVSGNTANGLRISNSDNTTIHANFFGLAANNQDPLGNGLNGTLIEGNSGNTQYGGVIPLGNVNSGNGANGIEVKDQATGFITFNTFAGTTAFGGIAPNQGDGMLFTSTGGDNTIRTNVIGGNNGNGIRIAGSATGITVDPNIIGLNSFGTADTYVSSTGEVVSYGNKGDGIRVEGEASAITIAGTYASVIPQNTISNNDGYGIRVTGNASNVQIANAAIGTGSIVGDEALQFGNHLGGVFVGGSADQVTVGDPSGVTQTLLANNSGSGLMIEGSLNNQISQTEFRNNGTYGLSFLGVNAIEADRQSGEGLEFDANADGAVQIAPGWANLSLTKAVDSDRFTLTADSTISVLRLDTGAEGIRFGIENAASGSGLDLAALVAASENSLNLEKILSGTWAETEGVALGGRTASSVAADTWIPVATDASGQRLTLESLVLSGNSASARFAGGVEAVYAVGGSGLLASSIADGPLATVAATVKRLGAFNNGLALYEADALTGAVDGLLPGAEGYLQAALQAAKRGGTLFLDHQLPGYGENGNLNLTLSPEKNYGFLLIVDGDEGNLYSSYSAANPDESIQITSFTTPDGALTFGFEDLLTSRNTSDQDFNDLIVSIKPVAEESARIPNSNPWIRPDQQSYFQLDELIPEARDLYEDLQKGENAISDKETVLTIELILKRREVDRSAVESSGQYSFQRFYDTDELLSLSYQELQSYTSQLSEQDLIDLYGADEQTIQDVVGFLQRSGATNINHDSAKEQRTLSFDISLADFLTAFTDGKQNLLNLETDSYRYLYQWIGKGGPSDSYLTAVGEGAEAFANAILGLEFLPAKTNTADANSNNATSGDALKSYNFYPIDIAKTYNFPGTDLATVGNGARIGLVGTGGNKAMLGWKDSDAYSQYLEAQGRNPNLAADIRSLDASVADGPPVEGQIGGEQMLDISVLASVAPGAEIVASAYEDPLSNALELYKNYAQLIYLDGENSVDVISSSVQYPSSINYFSQALDELFLDAVLRGIPVVVAAGDRGTANPNGAGLKYGLSSPLFNQSTGSAAALSVGGTAFNKEAISLSPDGSSNTASSADNQTTWNELNTFHTFTYPGLNFSLGNNYEPDAWNVADILQKPDTLFFNGSGGLWQGIGSSGRWEESSGLLGAGYQRDNLTGEWQDVWRSYPDISILAGANAANGTATQMYINVNYNTDGDYSFGSEASDGTSASAPLTAALLAIAASELKQNYGDDAKLGFINPLLYQLYNSTARDQVFFDVPAGSNNANVYSTPATPEEWNGVYVAFEEILNSDRTLREVQLYPLNGTLPNGELDSNLSSTGPGFDAATGLGSLNGQGFLDQLLAIYGTL